MDSKRYCKICKKKIPNNIIIKNKVIENYTRKYCYICLPYKSKIPNKYFNKKPPTRKCKICKKKFSIKIGNKCFYNRKNHCFKCVPVGKTYNKDLGSDGKKCKCIICGKKYIYKRRGSNRNLSKCYVCLRREYCKKLKIRSVEYAGGKCRLCGFNKYITALVFHHVNGKKEFNISKTRWRVSWERIRKEINKCILLCSNCHAGVHAGDIKI